MTTLILETSSEKALIALVEDGKCLAEKHLPGGPGLSKTLALEVKTLLSDCIPNRIAVGTGPGSYTGIRVGTSLAKALAFGWQIPLFGFCSLKAFPSPVVIDARMHGFYLLPNLDAFPQLYPELNQSNLFSPHPERIEKRLKIPCKEAYPEPLQIIPYLEQTLNLVYPA